ncbi:MULTISPECIES: hypothetical protein [unclassified Desulfovibrio]|uniref:hypothetical protein n=1 Tax=unclassified Desulfovibrio TaxID=2593640 RepID=UPI0013EAFE24|nr:MULTISPECIES: hypothetical protein [unclassified Desulfovibrio]
MQDRYVGDIGDYGKLGLLRAITKHRLTLAINWYKTIPGAHELKKQDDGKFTKYLKDSSYSLYDPELYDQLQIIVNKHRNIETIENDELGIVHAEFYGVPVPKGERKLWHTTALEKLGGKDIVFLDPDNGIETQAMVAEKRTSQKHVKWAEIAGYYNQGQSILIYQHQPRIKEKDFIKKLQAKPEFKNADYIRIIKYSRYTSRFYILLLHKKHLRKVDSALSELEGRLHKFCDKIYWRN